MKRVLRALLILCCPLLVVVSLSTLSRSAEWPPVSPDDLKMTAEPLAPGAPAIILYRQVDRDDNGRTGHEIDFVRIKILKEEGRKYADVEIPFLKGFGNNIVNIRARTIRPDGSIVSFEGKAFDKEIVKAKGVKYMAKTFTLPDVEVGCIIEYSYTVDLAEYFVFNSDWILNDELFTKYAKFSLKPYTSDYSNLHLRWTWRLLPIGTTPPTQGPDHVVRMEASNVPAFQIEDFMPPQNEMKSRVNFIYTDDLETKDAAQFWKNRGRKLNSGVEGFVGKPKAMQEAVGQIVSASDPPQLKLQKIYTRVQQIHNTSYDVEKTAQEEKRDKEKENTNVEDVWKRGYGNGRQINWLFLALVRAAGFEAYAIYASDRRNYFFNPALMDANKLDADLVLVKVEGKDVFCDPGAALTPFGLLEWPETGVTGLRLDKDGGTWIKTMLPESTASRTMRRADLTLSETGDLEGKLTITFTGLEAMRRRVTERNQDQADRKKFLEDEAKEDIPAACDLELSNSPQWDTSSDPLIAEFTLKVPGWLSAAGKRALLPVGLFSASEKNVFEHEQRIYPIYFEFPSTKEDAITITLPQGWQVSSLPPAQTKDGHVVVYSLKTENDKDKVKITRNLTMDLLLLDQKYYPALRNFFQTVRTGDEQQIVLQPGSAAASN